MNDNLLMRLNNIYQPEPVPMAPTPSIVKVSEGDQVYMAPTASVRPPQRPQDLGVQPNPQMTPAAPAAPMAAPEVPPELSAPGTLVPPETNETLSAVDGAPIPVPPLDANRDQIAGDVAAANAQRNKDLTEPPAPSPFPGGFIPRDPYNPDSHGLIPNTDEIANIAVDDPSELPAIAAKRDADRKARSMAGKPRTELADAGALPGEENMVPQNEEDSAAMQQAIEENIPEVPAGENPPENRVTAPNGEELTVSRSDVTRAAAEDPVGFSKAMNWVQKTFGITGQDLARFALFYVGSRIAGYKHGESMSWAFQAGAAFLQNRTDLAGKLSQTGKYTAKSLEAYRMSGDMSDLELVDTSSGENALKIDYTDPHYVKGESGSESMVFPAQDANGNKFWVDSKGNQAYIGSVETQTQDAAMADTRDDRVGTVSDIGNEFYRQMDKDHPWYVGSPTADAEIVTNRLDWWTKEQQVPYDPAVQAAVVRNAYVEAQRWAGSTGNQVTDMSPFIDAQMLYMSQKTPWFGQLKVDNHELNPKQINELNSTLMGVIRTLPNYKPSQNRGELIQKTLESLWVRYASMSEEERKPYEKHDGFYSFINTWATTTK